MSKHGEAWAQDERAMDGKALLRDSGELNERNGDGPSSGRDGPTNRPNRSPTMDDEGAMDQHAPADDSRSTRFSLWDFATKFRSSDGVRDRATVDDGQSGYGARGHPPVQGQRPSDVARDHPPVQGQRSSDAARDYPTVGDRRAPAAAREHVPDQGSRYEDVRSLEAFMAIVEDMRAYLVGMRTQTEDDQIEYGTTLNRAVLGYSRERQAFLAVIQDRLASRRLHQQKPPSSQYETMAEAVFAEVIGMNVLESVMRERADLEEIQVVGTRIFEVRNGFVRKSHYRFRSVDEVERLQQNLVLYNRDTINARKQWAEVSLPDGARVTMTGFGYTREPTITIRFFPLREVSLSRLAKPPYSTLDEEAIAVLQAIVAARLNLIVIGATNTGKSHLLKALIADIPDEQRIVTIEPRSELLLGMLFPDKNIVEFEAPDDDAVHGGGQAFRLALRQSPERIILAEIRDQEANLYVRACTRGHMGSMTTAHVNALEDVPDAITDMCMLDKRGMNPERLRRRIAQFVTQIGIEMRVVAGQRKIVRVGEISEREGQVYVRDLIAYDHERDRWRRCHPFSQSFGEHIRRYSPEHHKLLQRKGWVSD